MFDQVTYTLFDSIERLETGAEMERNNGGKPPSGISAARNTGLSGGLSGGHSGHQAAVDKRFYEGGQRTCRGYTSCALSALTTLGALCGAIDASAPPSSPVSPSTSTPLGRRCCAAIARAVSGVIVI